MDTKEKTCDFCSRPENRERTVLRTNRVWSFLTNMPITPGHTLICPTRCVETFGELTIPELVEIQDHLRQVHFAALAVFGAVDFNHSWNQGEIAGQSVPHFHLHVVPRTVGDAGITKYEPRKFLYRPGSREPSPEAELRQIAYVLRSAIV